MSVEELNPNQVKRNHPKIHEVFFEDKNPRREGESLHDYFTRKGMNCFCPNCRNKPKAVPANT